MRPAARPATASGDTGRRRSLGPTRQRPDGDHRGSGGAPAPADGGPAPAGSWLRRRAGDLTAAALVLLVAAMSVRRFAQSPAISVDEGTYTGQAWAVLSGSLAPYTYFYDHPPVGWIQLAPVLWLSEAADWTDSAIVSARVAPALALLAGAVLLYALARRLGAAKVPAAAGAVVFVCSPLTREYLHRVYLDGLALPWLLAAFVVVLAPRRRSRQLVASAVLLAIAVLTKESTLLMYPALLAAVVVGAAPGQRRRAAALHAGVLAAIGACYPLYALAGGDALVFAKALGWQLVARQGSGSITDPDSGRNDTVLAWIERDPVLVTAGLAAAILLLGLRRRHWYVGLTVLVPVVVAVKPGGYLPGMFIAIVVPFLVLCPVLLVGRLADGRRRSGFGPLPGAVRPVAVLAIAVVVAASVLRAVPDTAPADETAGEIAVARWVRDNLPADATVLVDDAVFAELYVHGRTDVWRQALMVYKLDYDANVAAFVPRGWLEVEYAVVTPKLRHAASSADAVQAHAVLAHGEVIARLGPQSGNTEILRVRAAPVTR